MYMTKFLFIKSSCIGMDWSRNLSVTHAWVTGTRLVKQTNLLRQSATKLKRLNLCLWWFLSKWLG